MTTKRMSEPDFDQLLTAWFEADAPTREPEGLLDRSLVRTATARRRPAWILPEWWIPAQLTVPLRAAGRLVPVLVVLALVVALATAILIIGSRQRLPDPFGPAGNGDLAYISNGQIYTSRPNGSDIVQLTFDDRSVAMPVFSRDGTKVAFKRISATSGLDDPGLVGDLVIANADGTNPVTIDPEAEGMSPTSWSADGRWVVYSRSIGATEQVFIAPSDGSSPPTQLTDRGPLSWSPVVSPDGRQVAYVVGDVRIQVMNLDGSGDHQVNTTPFESISDLQWHPDGDRLIVSAGRGPDPARWYAILDLWIVRLNGSDDQRITRRGGAETSASWSPDGSQLAYLQWELDYRARLIVADADGGNPRELPGRYGTIPPIWSPDGTRIAAIDDLGATPRVVLVDPDGEAEPVVIEGAFPPEGAIAVRSDFVSWQRVAP